MKAKQKKIAALRERVRVLEAALRPFARKSAALPSWVEDRVSLATQVKYGDQGVLPGRRLNVGHLRVAAAAIEPRG